MIIGLSVFEGKVVLVQKNENIPKIFSAEKTVAKFENYRL